MAPGQARGENPTSIRAATVYALGSNAGTQLLRAGRRRTPSPIAT